MAADIEGRVMVDGAVDESSVALQTASIVDNSVSRSVERPVLAELRPTISESD